MVSADRTSVRCAFEEATVQIRQAEGCHPVAGTVDRTDSCEKGRVVGSAHIRAVADEPAARDRAPGVVDDGAGRDRRRIEGLDHQLRKERRHQNVLCGAFSDLPLGRDNRGKKMRESDAPRREACAVDRALCDLVIGYAARREFCRRHR